MVTLVKRDLSHAIGWTKKRKVEAVVWFKRKKRNENNQQRKRKGCRAFQIRNIIEVLNNNMIIT